MVVGAALASRLFRIFKEKFMTEADIFKALDEARRLLLQQGCDKTPSNTNGHGE